MKTTGGKEEDSKPKNGAIPLARSFTQELHALVNESNANGLDSNGGDSHFLEHLNSYGGDVNPTKNDTGGDPSISHAKTSVDSTSAVRYENDDEVPMGIQRSNTKMSVGSSGTVEVELSDFEDHLEDDDGSSYGDTTSSLMKVRTRSKRAKMSRVAPTSDGDDLNESDDDSARMNATQAISSGRKRLKLRRHGSSSGAKAKLKSLRNNRMQALLAISKKRSCKNKLKNQHSVVMSESDSEDEETSSALSTVGVDREAETRGKDDFPAIRDARLDVSRTTSIISKALQLIRRSSAIESGVFEANSKVATGDTGKSGKHLGFPTSASISLTATKSLGSMAMSTHSGITTMTDTGALDSGESAGKLDFHSMVSQLIDFMDTEGAQGNSKKSILKASEKSKAPFFRSRKRGVNQTGRQSRQSKRRMSFKKGAGGKSSKKLPLWHNGGKMRASGKKVIIANRLKTQKQGPTYGIDGSNFDAMISAVSDMNEGKEEENSMVKRASLFDASGRSLVDESVLHQLDQLNDFIEKDGGAHKKRSSRKSLLQSKAMRLAQQMASAAMKAKEKRDMLKEKRAKEAQLEKEKRKKADRELKMKIIEDVREEKICTTLSGSHRKSCSCVLFTEDGKFLITASRDKTAKVWSVEKPQEGPIFSLEGHTMSITDMCFAQGVGEGEGIALVTSSKDTNLKIWDICTGELVRTIEEHDAAVLCVASIPSNPSLCFTGCLDENIRLVDLDEGTMLQVLRGHQGPVIDIATSFDGRILVSASEDCSLRMWNYNKKIKKTYFKKMLIGHKSPVLCVTVSTGSDFVVASGSFDGSLCIWSCDGEQLHHFQAHKQQIWGMCLSRDQQSLYTASQDRKLLLFDLESCALQAVVIGEDFEVDWKLSCVAASSTGNTIAIGGHPDGAVLMWNVCAGDLRMELLGHRDVITSVAICSDFVLSGSQDGQARLWSATNGHPLCAINCTGSIVEDSRYSELMHDEYVVSVDIAPPDFLTDTFKVPITALKSADEHKEKISNTDPPESADISRSTLFVLGTSLGSVLVLSFDTDTHRVRLLHSISGKRNEDEKLQKLKAKEATAVKFVSPAYVAISKGNRFVLRSAVSFDILHSASLERTSCMITAMVPMHNAGGAICGTSDGEVGLIRWSNTPLIPRNENADSAKNVDASSTLLKMGNSNGAFAWSKSVEDSPVVSMTSSPTCEYTIAGFMNSVVAVFKVLQQEFAPSQVDAAKAPCSIKISCVRTHTLDSEGYLPITGVAFPDNNLYCASTGVREIKIWDNKTGEEVLMGEVSVQVDEDISALYSYGTNLWASIGSSLQCYDLTKRQPSVAVSAYHCFDGKSAKLIEAYPEIVNCRDFSGDTLLHIFARRGQETVVEDLLKTSAYIGFLYNREGKSALDIAIEEREGAIVKQLAVCAVERKNEMRSSEFKALAMSLPNMATYYPEHFRYFLKSIGTVAYDENAISEINAAVGKLPVAYLPIVQTSETIDGVAINWTKNRDVDHAIAMRKENYEKDRARVIASCCPLPNLGHPLIFQKIVENRKLHDCILSEAIKPVLLYKWKTYGSDMFRSELYKYLAYVACVTIYCLTLSMSDADVKTWDNLGKVSNMICFVSLALGSLLAVRLLKREIIQMTFEKGSYFASFWNWIDVLRSISYISTVVLYCIRSIHVFAVSSLLGLFTWFGTLFYMRAHRNFGAMIRMIMETISDMKFFTLILIVVAIGFCVCSYTLFAVQKHQHLSLPQLQINSDSSTDQVPEATVPISQVNVFRSFVEVWTGLMGNFDYNSYDRSEYTLIFWLVYLMFTFLVVIIMFNLLIALMTDSYERIVATIEKARDIEVAGIIVDIERQFSSHEFRMQKYFPTYVHMLDVHVRQDEKLAQGWAGRTKAITKHVTESNSTLEASLLRKIDNMMKETVAGLSERIDRLEAKLVPAE